MPDHLGVKRGSAGRDAGDGGGELVYVGDRSLSR
jgi:hypothetical protein